MWDKVKQFNKAFGIDTSRDLVLDLDLDQEDINFISSLKTIEQSCRILSEMPSVSKRGLRIKLLSEEFHEYLTAELDNDIIEIADALTDIHYIAAGTEDIYGIPGEKLFNHIHENNMSKLGKDGKPIRREDGKIMKPEGYVKPNVAKVLDI